jgi:hypothetical protein
MTLNEEEEFERAWARLEGIDGRRPSISREEAHTMFAAGVRMGSA